MIRSIVERENKHELRQGLTDEVMRLLLGTDERDRQRAARKVLARKSSVRGASIVLRKRSRLHGYEPIVLGQVSLSFYAVVGGVVQEVLEQKGYTVEVIEGPHAEIFPQLGAGEVDMLAAAWLPSGHGALYEPVRDVTFEIAPIYDNADFFWVVPDYAPEDKVASIDDLAKPEIAERMPDTIVSLPEATGLTTGSRRVMNAYGLGDAGYKLVAAPPGMARNVPLRRRE